MDLKQLEYFVRVAELGSFTRASIALDIAQPALSRQIRQLEVELRQTLLTRTGRGVVPTEAGKLLLEHGRGILHQVERAKEDLGRVRGSVAGRVAVGLPPSVAKALTVPLTREFRKRLPDATLSITESLSTAMQESLISGRLDIAVLYNPSPNSDVDTTPLIEEDLYLVVRHDHPLAGQAITLADLANEPLVIPTRPNAIRMLVESTLAERGLRPTIELEIDGVSAILDLVADGAGFAVLSRNAVESSGKTEVLTTRPIVEHGIKSRIALAVSSQRPATLTQQAMIEVIGELLVAIMGSK